MALPLSTNTACDVYHVGNAPPAAPDIAALAIYLKPDWVAGQEHGDRRVNVLTWTHIMLTAPSIDIRDPYAGGSTSNSSGDTIYVPDQNGTPFLVVKIERINPGLASEHKRVFLDRQIPSWPTNEL